MLFSSQKQKNDIHKKNHAYMISIEYQGKNYNIPEELFETREDSYKRGWFVSKNKDTCSFKEIYSKSLMFLNKKKGMKYE